MRDSPDISPFSPRKSVSAPTYPGAFPVRGPGCSPTSGAFREGALWSEEGFPRSARSQTWSSVLASLTRVPHGGGPPATPLLLHPAPLGSHRAPAGLPPRRCIPLSTLPPRSHSFSPLTSSWVPPRAQSALPASPLLPRLHILPPARPFPLPALPKLNLGLWVMHGYETLPSEPGDSPCAPQKLFGGPPDRKRTSAPERPEITCGRKPWCSTRCLLGVIVLGQAPPFPL